MGKESAAVYDVWLDAPNHLLVLAADGLWKLDLKGLKPPIASLTTLTWNPQAGDRLLKRSNGQLWISAVGSVFLLKHEHLQSFIMESGERIHLAEDQKGRLWAVGSRGKVYQYKQEQNHFLPQPVAYNLGNVRHLEMSSSNSIITGGKGLHELFISEDGKIDHIEKLPLQSDSIGCFSVGNSQRFVGF